MYPLLWFLLGILAAFTALFVFWLGREREEVSAAIDEEEGEDQIEPPVEYRLATELLDDTSTQLESVAGSIGAELANLATGVEGHAQQLCEAMDQPALVVSRAEQLWRGVRRLRLFSEKIISFSQGSELEILQVEMRPLLSSLRQELEEYAGGSLKIELNIAASLPPALAAEYALRNSIIFLADTLLYLEPNASLLTISASNRLSEEDAPQVEIELSAEPEDSAEPRTAPRQDVQYGYLAARNLLINQGATLSFDHVEGLNVSCLITLPAAESADPDQAIQVGPNPEEEHPYGGVLILEDDCSIREMLATELRKTGRNIFTAADGASARSLLEATPERFELLILDQQARGEPGDQLARRALDLHPEVKILLLSTDHSPGFKLSRESRQRLVMIPKPFALMELREGIGILLGTWKGAGEEDFELDAKPPAPAQPLAESKPSEAAQDPLLS
jgi:CheY-like chemotaxis protein